MVGKLDKEIIEKFEEFQEKTGKHSELYIEDVEFENISLSNEKYFTFIKGKNKYIQRYIKVNKGDYPILGSSLKNSCISAYIKPIDESDIVNQESVTFNKDNAKGSVPFFRDYPYLMDRHHIAIIPNDDLVNAKYLEKSLIRFFEQSKFGWGDNVADVSAVKKHLVPIPQDLNKFYSSYQIQEAIVEFLEYSFNEIETIKERIDKRYKIFERLKKALIPSTFIKDYVKVAFGRYAKEKGIGFNITDVEFEIKRIHAGKDNVDDLICEKRMGFTPKNNSHGDINWFSVRDLGRNKELYINNPNTSKKTTMNLIKQQVDKKNTGKSEKLIPIKKDDILISFKLTVGVVKIYNSEKPAYCNEAIDILTVNDNIYSKYVAYNCMLEYPKYGTKTNNGVTLNDDDKKKIKIFIPKPLENYTSYKIQKIIADFIEDIENELQVEFDKMDKAYRALKRLHTAYLARTFTLIDWGEK
jgi:hypothetical protein